MLVKIDKDTITSEEIQNEYIQLSQLFNKDSDIKRVNMLQGFTDILEDLENQTEYMKTWFNKIDNYILIDKGDYIIIGGRPSSGKNYISNKFYDRAFKKIYSKFF